MISRKLKSLLPSIVVTLIFPATVALAVELPSTTTDMVDTRGSVLYCSGIYQEPANRGRIYDGDLLTCDKSDRLLRWLAEANFSPAEQEILAQKAIRKSAAIRYNTRSVQDAVMACRKQCRGLAGWYDKMVENGQISAFQD